MDQAQPGNNIAEFVPVDQFLCVEVNDGAQ